MYKLSDLFGWYVQTIPFATKSETWAAVKPSSKETSSPT